MTTMEAINTFFTDYIYILSFFLFLIGLVVAMVVSHWVSKKDKNSAAQQYLDKLKQTEKKHDKSRCRKLFIRNIADFK
jgi:hypothetical protein